MSPLRYLFPLDRKNLMFIVMIITMFTIVVDSYGIFMPYVPVFVKTKQEIIFMSAGKSEDMNVKNHAHNLVN